MDNIPVMTQIIKKCIEVKRTPLLWGKHGIGKSDIIRDIGEQLGFDKVIDLRLGQLEVGDLIGMPDREYYCPSCKTSFGTKGDLIFCPVCEDEGRGKVAIAGRTIFLPPDWLPQNGEKYLLFFDEFNRGRLDVQQAAFQIVLDRKIHRHVIPDNCAIICACNPSGGNYNVEELDEALIDRFINIKFSLRADEWLKWATDHNINENIVDFIMTDNTALGADPIEIPVEIKPSPRSYEFLSNVITGLDRNYWSATAAMIVGETTALQFMASLKTDLDKPVRAKDIFDKFNDKKDPSKATPTRRKVIAQCRKTEGQTRFDLLDQTIKEIVRDLKDDQSKKYNESQLNNLGDFLLLIPKDLAFTAIKDLSLMNDVNMRLLLIRTDLFDLIKGARGTDKDG